MLAIAYTKLVAKYVLAAYNDLKKDDPYARDLVSFKFIDESKDDEEFPFFHSTRSVLGRLEFTRKTSVRDPLHHSIYWTDFYWNDFWFDWAVPVYARG